MAGDDARARVAAALVDAAAAGRDLPALLATLCEAMAGAGVPLARAAAGALLLHPLLDATLAVWRRGSGAHVIDTPRPAPLARGQEAWRGSPHHHLQLTGGTLLRRRLEQGEGAGEFPVLAEFAAEGATDYLATRTRLGPEATLGGADDLFTSWVSDRPGGFAEGDVALIRALLPLAAVVFAGALNTATARTLLATYLGADAARRVLRGEVERGRADTVRAAIWYSDLEGFTRLADTLPRDAILGLLNAYAEIQVDAIEAGGGQVLKFVGDGILATFEAPDTGEACGAALAAWETAFRLCEGLGARRAAEGLPATRPYLALHVGEVLYGNVGGRARLDFTVLGPAVNEASRIAALCRQLDQPAILSEAFALACPPAWQGRLVGLGRYALRGVARPQMLFALGPAGAGGAEGLGPAPA